MGQQLVERGGPGRELGGNLVADVHSHSQREPLERLPLPATFAQHAGQLAVVEEHVVGPLQPRARAAQQLVHRVGHHEAGADRQRADVRA